VRRINHRELRNNSSEILRSVDNGESFEITNYGRVVALIVPAPLSPLEQLRAAGRIRRPTLSPGDLLEIEPIRVPEESDTALDALRAER